MASAPALTGSGELPARRRPAAAVPAITGLILSPNAAEATLVNISTSGLLADCAVRFKVGDAVRITFEGTFVPRSVDGSVVRTSVVSMAASGIRYHVAVAFKASLDLDQPSPAQFPEANGGRTDQAPVQTPAWTSPPPTVSDLQRAFYFKGGAS